MGVDSRNDTLLTGNRAGDQRQASDPPRATIVVLDDDELFRQELCRALLMEHFAAIEAADLSELHHALEAHPVDLVVADSRLPDGDGWATANALSKDGGFKVLPVSGYDTDAIAAIGGEIVDEPITKRRILELIRAIEKALAA